jgi:EAL domain-containing protein (putative c-di-GMP-specific phosphodiesterase class I)
LPAAEGSTLIKRLTTFVLDHALDSCHTWLDHGVNIPVSVNVSARSLCDPDFATVISERLAYANVPAELLTIELSDTNATTYVSLAPGSLQALRDIGVQLSLGDYGSRYLTMAYLKNLPITELKIDRAFIQGLTSDVNDAVIVQSVTELGHNLGLTVIAEGVEDQPTLTIVKALGIDIAQGFHIGHPMPEHRLLQWITDRTNGTAPFETIAHGSPPSPTR